MTTSRPAYWTELAQGQPASASSYWDGYYIYYGNDGKNETSWGAAPIAYDPFPWWQVDLQQACRIHQIEFITRTTADYLFDRRNFEILAANDRRMIQDDVVRLGGRGDEAIRGLGVSWTLDVHDPTPYRFIRICKTRDETRRDSADHALGFAQLRVWGERL